MKLIITLYLLVSSADNFCKQFVPRSSESKLFETLMVFLNEFFKKADVEKISRQQKKKKHMQNFPAVNKLNIPQLFSYTETNSSNLLFQQVLLHGGESRDFETTTMANTIEKTLIQVILSLIFPLKLVRLA